MKQSSPKKPLVSAITTVLLLLATLAVVHYRQLIVDAYAYYRYQPNDEVALFAENTGMNERGKFLFYASQPLLQDAKDFRDSCDRKEASSVVLGCYNGQTIYIYNVTDERIRSIRETTAAHEMLHAAYQRLSQKDREHVNGLLEAEYTILQSNQDLADRVSLYDRTEPGERLNELHSIIGTEIQTISPELEEYYRQYFTDRSKVVALHEQHDTVFTQLRSRAEELRGQINKLNDTIQSKTSAYTADVVNVQKEVSDFNQRAQSGNFASQSEFAKERQILLAKSNALEVARQEINSEVDLYNKLVTELNGIATETNTLNESLDSHVTAPPSL